VESGVGVRLVRIMRFYGMLGVMEFFFFRLWDFFLGSKDMGLSKLRNLVFGSNHLFIFLFCFLRQGLKFFLSDIDTYSRLCTETPDRGG
jgi:hypothetical protein